MPAPALGGRVQEPREDASAAAAPRAQDRYQKLEKIGEGSCGVVFKCRDRVGGRIVAVKKVNFSYDGDSAVEAFGVPAAALREASSMKALAGHPNIVTLYEAFLEKERVFLVCEFVDRDLRAQMNREGQMHPARAKLYIWQVLQALAHCHAHRIAHRDVKPQNLLVEVETDTIKLCDFSLARVVFSPQEVQTRRVASLWYRSPEILLGGKAEGMALDCWSSGCVLGEMLLHSPMFPGRSEIETIFLHFRLLGTPRESSWPGVSGLPHWSAKFPKFETSTDDILGGAAGAASPLLRWMLRLAPAGRPSMECALAHKYFADLDTAGRCSRAPGVPPRPHPGVLPTGASKDGGECQQVVAKRRRGEPE